MKTPSNELVTRLRKRKSIPSGDPELGPLTGNLVNPDGPEAAQEIERVKKEAAEEREDHRATRERLKELSLDVIQWWRVVFNTDWVHTKPDETPMQLAQRGREEIERFREALEYICHQDGKGADGLIDWQRCVDRIQEVARSALTPSIKRG